MAKRKHPEPQVSDAEVLGMVSRALDVSPDLVSRAQFIRRHSEHLFIACFWGLITIDQAERVISQVEKEKSESGGA